MKKIVACIFSLCCICNLLYGQQEPTTTNNKKAAKLYDEAANYYSSNQGEKAIDLLKKAIKEDSNFVEAQGMLGYIYDDLGNEDEAIKQYKTVIRINPGFHPEIYLDAGRLEMEKELYNDAQINLEKFLKSGKGDK